MGYQTAVMILNDAMHNLKTDPNVGQNIHDAIMETSHPRNSDGVSFAIGNHGNAGHVLRSEHADVVQCIAVGGNYMRNIGYGGNWQDMNDSLQLVKNLADAMGYRLVKK